MPSSSIQKTVNDIFDEIDTNNDGVITRSEFINVVGVQSAPTAAGTHELLPLIQSTLENRLAKERVEWNEAMQKCTLAQVQQMDRIICDKVNRSIDGLSSSCKAQFDNLRLEVQQKLSSDTLEASLASIQHELEKAREQEIRLQQKENLLSGMTHDHGLLRREMDELHDIRKELEGRVADLHAAHQDTHTGTRELSAQLAGRMGKNHEDMCALLEEEHLARVHDIQEVQTAFSKRIADAMSRESQERAAQLQELSRQIEAETVDRSAKLEEQRTWQAQLEALHHQIIDSFVQLEQGHAELKASHMALESNHQERHKSHGQKFGELETLLGTHRETWESDCQTLMEGFSAEIADLRDHIRRIDATSDDNHSHHLNRHKELGDDLDSKHNDLSQTLAQLTARWDTKFHELEPKVDRFTFRVDNIDAQLDGQFSSVKHQIEEVQRTFERALATSQQQTSNEAQAANLNFMNTLKAETNQRSQSVQELQDRLVHEVTQLRETCDKLSRDFTDECKAIRGDLGDSIKEHHDSSRTTSSQYTSDLVAAVKEGIERTLQELSEQVKGLDQSLTEHGAGHAKALEEIQTLHSQKIAEERDALLEKLQTLQSKFSSDLSLHNDVHSQGRDQLEAMLESERKSREESLKMEGASRSQALQEHAEALTNQFEEIVKREREERAQKFSDLIQSFDDECARRNEQFEKHDAKHNDLISAHAELRDSHKNLQDAHAGQVSAHLQRLDDHADKHGELEKLLGSHNERWEANHEALKQGFSAQVSEVHDILKSLQTTTHSNRNDQDVVNNEIRSDTDAKVKEIFNFINENHTKLEARFSVLEPHVSTNAFRVESVSNDMSDGFVALRQQIEAARNDLFRVFQAGQEKITNDVEMVRVQHLALIEQEGEKRCSHIEQLESELSQNIVEISTKCDVVKEVVVRDCESRLKEQDQVLSTKQTEALNRLSVELNDVVTLLRRDTEKGIRDGQERLEELRSSTIAERNNHMRKFEEERAKYKKAHEQHMSCLNLEQDTRVQDIATIRADLAKGLADARKVHAESYSQLETLIQLEQTARQNLIETEVAKRSKELQDLRNHVNELSTTERSARAQQLEDKMRVLNEENSERDRRLGAHQKAHEELKGSHAQLTAMHGKLFSSHEELYSSHKDSHQMLLEARNRHEDLLQSERDKRLTDLKKVEETYNLNIANIHSELRRLETLITADEQIFETKQNELGTDLDSRWKAMNQLLDDRIHAVEARLNVNEARIDAGSIGLEDTIKDTNISFYELRSRVSQTEDLIECSSQAQKDFASKVDASTAQLANTIKSDNAQQCLNFQDFEKRVNEELSIIKMRSEEIRKETMHEYHLAHNNLDRSLSARHETCIATSSQQVMNIAAAIKSENERRLLDFEQRISEVSTGLQTERNNHSKWMEEERAAFKKSHEEHMRCVEMERDARLRQATELRADLMQLISKDREERIVDTAERRSDAAKRQALTNTLGNTLGSSAPGSAQASALNRNLYGSNTAETPSMAPSPTLDMLLRSMKAK